MNEGGRLRLNSVRICADCICVSRLVSLGPSPCHLRTGRNAKQDSSSSTQPELVLISTLQLCSSCGFCAVLGLASPDGETSACENAVHDMLSYPTQEPVLLVSSHPYGILVCRNLGDWFHDGGGDQELNQRPSSDCEDAEKAQWAQRVFVLIVLYRRLRVSRGLPSNLCLFWLDNSHPSLLDR